MTRNKYGKVIEIYTNDTEALNLKEFAELAQEAAEKLQNEIRESINVEEDTWEIMKLEQAYGVTVVVKCYGTEK
jgi:hypothetical protein